MATVLVCPFCADTQELSYSEDTCPDCGRPLEEIDELVLYWGNETRFYCPECGAEEPERCYCGVQEIYISPSEY